MLGVSGSKLLSAIIHADTGKISLTGSHSLEHEIASVHVTTKYSPGTPGLEAVCVVGLWTDISVRIIALPSFKEIRKEKLGGGKKKKKKKLILLKQKKILSTFLSFTFNLFSDRYFTSIYFDYQVGRFGLFISRAG